MVSKEDIASQWCGDVGGYGQAEVWDEAAAGYAAKPLPIFESDRFLQFLDAEGAIGSKNPRILDIGCGAGAYSIALAKHIGSGAEVFGCDISPKMIEAAQKRAADEGCDNVHFICGDFAKLSVEKLLKVDPGSFGGKDSHSFDLVFAHFTPALSCAEDLEKMMSLVKPGGWCFTAMHARRTDALLQRLRELVGLPPKTDRLDETLLQAFSYVWLSDKTPTVVHYPNEWTSTRTLEDAKRIYGHHLVATDLTPDQQAVVDEYLEHVTEGDEEGLVRERCTSTVVMMGWQM